MNIRELPTPCTLLDMDVLSRNIARVQRMCDEAGVELWPMTKTHKCGRIARMQLEAGARGFLAGTLSEAEALANLGAPQAVYAYPIANAANIRRALGIAKRMRLIISVDSAHSARMLGEAFDASGMVCEYAVIIDSGLGRLGIKPSEAGSFTLALYGQPGLCFAGIGTHPGQVYGCSSADGVAACVAQEKLAVDTALRSLADAGLSCPMAASGSTPTLEGSLKNRAITVQRPGNYVFYDRIQQSLGACVEDDFALTVLATVIANPAPGRYIIDAGSKMLGLDLGAHGVANVRGYGGVIGHPELEIASLSEEVGRVVCDGATDIAIGSRLRIVSNHSCAAANLAHAYTAVSGDEVTGRVELDMRGPA